MKKFSQNRLGKILADFRWEVYDVEATVTRHSELQMSYAHHHGEFEMNMLVNGTATYFFRDQTFQVPRRRMIVFWAASPHSLIKASSDAEWLVADVPLEEVLSWGLPEPFIRSLLLGEICIDASEKNFEKDAAMIRSWAESNFRSDPNWRRIILLEAQAVFLRMALEQKEPADQKHKSLSSSKMNRATEMLKFIHAHSSEDIKVRDIAAALRLNPNYATTLFREIMGQGLQRYMKRVRLAHAARLLLTTDDTVLTVALESGYTSQSQFYTDFKRAFGLAPSGYRNRF